MTRPVIIKEPVTASGRKFQALGACVRKFFRLLWAALYYFSGRLLQSKEPLHP